MPTTGKYAFRQRVATDWQNLNNGPAAVDDDDEPSSPHGANHGASLVGSGGLMVAPGTSAPRRRPLLQQRAIRRAVLPTTKKPLPQFVRKLYDIATTCDTSIAHWSGRGDAFLIRDKHRFASDVLARYFTSANFTSFVRQLHFYNFHKVDKQDASCWEFRHPLFLRGRWDLLGYLKRKTNHEGGRAALPRGTDLSPVAASAGLDAQRIPARYQSVYGVGGGRPAAGTRTRRTSGRRRGRPRRSSYAPAAADPPFSGTGYVGPDDANQVGGGAPLPSPGAAATSGFVFATGGGGGGGFGTGFGGDAGAIGSVGRSRVTMWNTRTQRKLSGAAAPIRANLERYLGEHPHMAVYVGQDLDRVSRAMRQSMEARDEQRHREELRQARARRGGGGGGGAGHIVPLTQ